MCIPTKLQQNIIDRTNEGDTIAAFLVDAMQGETPGVKVNHRMDAAKQLIKYGFTDTECKITSDRLSRAGGNPEGQGESTNTPSPSMGEGWDGGDNPPHPVVSYFDIINYQIAHLIRHETAEGHTVVNFLVDIMTGRDRPFTPKKFCIKPADRMAAARELLRRGWDTNHDNIKPKHLQAYWRDKESPRLSIGQKKTQARLSTSIDDYDNYDDTDYEAIAKEIREEEDRDVNSKPLRFQETVPSSRHSSKSRNLEDRQAASPATKLPLPQGEGWGEGKETNAPSTPTLPKSQSLNKSEDEPTADRKAIIKEFKEAMDRGDERAALRAEAKYRRIDVKPEKNIYDYGPNDPDPTVDYYFEPLNPEEQAKFDKEDRREHGLTDDEPATNGSANSPSQNATTDSPTPIKQAAELHGIPILPNPLDGKHKSPRIRSP